MTNLAILLRTSYFVKHNCHNLVSKDTFFSDHDFLATSYEKTLGHYDSVIERLIGLGQAPNLIQVQVSAVEKLKTIPISYKDNSECFYTILQINKSIINLIEQYCKSGKYSEGTRQLIGTIADELEIENYKLQQRLKK